MIKKKKVKIVATEYWFENKISSRQEIIKPLHFEKIAVIGGGILTALAYKLSYKNKVVVFEKEKIQDFTNQEEIAEYYTVDYLIILAI